ncbi:Aste57867_15145 [Aphanomyces stellatus]|uniref:Aste57867_15145 protein n=1 Tax=Aphanomyces stellatus TaxID=120398 RepID=A0A485L2G7_9STRA|nr:hypothetical protein As57867_015089 [Aphanomyces stellatus]VFT91954.1 Aste57867_15145 [Aphanomyces stellatus]
MELRKRSTGLKVETTVKELKAAEKSPHGRTPPTSTTELRSRSSSTVEIDLTQKLQRHNDIAGMLERNEIAPLIPSSSQPVTCDMCDALWTGLSFSRDRCHTLLFADESASALFEFRPSGVICDQSCLEFAASFVKKHPSLQSRTEYLGYRAAMEPNQSGVFRITVEKAVDLPSVRWVGRSDPYVRLALLPYVVRYVSSMIPDMRRRWNEPVQTKACMSGGKNPTWTDDHANEIRLQHRCNSSNNPVPTLEVQIWSDNYMINDDLLASTLLSTAPLLLHPNVTFSRWFTVASKSSHRARISFAMTFEPQARLRRIVSSIDTDEIVRDHRFRVHSLKSVGVILASCAVCERVIMSTTKTQWGYRCEDCGIDVHKSCMMLANTNLPCPNRDYAMADDDDENGMAPRPPRPRYVLSPRDRTGGGYLVVQPDEPPKLTFGKLFVNLQGVHVCSKACRGNDHATNVFAGDTYCRLAVDGMSRETKEVYKTADPVFDDKTCFVITHRDATFQLDLVDLNTNVSVGSLSVLLFELLQLDADDSVRAVASHLSMRGNAPEVALLAHGQPLPLKLKHAVVGLARISLHYEEEKQKLLLYVPKQRKVLQGREEKEFSVETLRTNMDRLGRVLQLAPWLEQQYLAIITWKHKPRSAIVLVLFTFVCLFLNAEYMPALLFYLALVYMLHTALLRLKGDYLTKWIAYDEDMMEQTKLFRPVATLHAAVLDADVPPARKDSHYIFVKVLYLPNDADQDDLGLVYSGGDQFLVGRTHSVRYTPHPKWRDASNVISHLSPPGLFRANAQPKKEHVFRNAHVSWPHVHDCTCQSCTTSSVAAKGVDYHTLVYPLLQAAKHFDNGRELLVPWAAFPGLLRFEVYSTQDDSGGGGAVPETLVATATVPLVRVVGLTEKTLSLPLEIHNDTDGQHRAGDMNLTVRLQIKLPVTSRGVASAAEKKWSNFVIEALAEKDKASTLGTALFGALWKAKDTTKMVQNGIGRLCATVVCTQNLFNWTHPWKTALVFAVCLAGAILFSIVPARYIILFGGLMEFVAGLREDRPPSNTARNILWNFISSLPTDMDLIQTYDVQRTQYVEERTKVEKIENAACRRLKFQALWMGTVVAKMEHERAWKTLCLAYRQSRFVFWKSMDDADMCLPPQGQLIIDRPDDIKEIPDLMARKADDPPFIFYVLGNTGESYQDKRFFGFADKSVRDEILAVVRASFKH